MRKPLVLIAIALACFGCSSVAASPTPSRYPQLVRQTFKNACEVNGTPEACECALDYLERHMTYDEFVALDAAGAEAVQADDRVNTAVAMCLN
jgi:hypothetical protein